jgi:hypothetical protein
VIRLILAAALVGGLLQQVLGHPPARRKGARKPARANTHPRRRQRARQPSVSAK